MAKSVALTVRIPAEIAEWLRSVVERKGADLYTADSIVTAALAAELPVMEMMTGIEDHADRWREHVELDGPHGTPHRLWELVEDGNQHLMKRAIAGWQARAEFAQGMVSDLREMEG